MTDMDVKYQDLKRDYEALKESNETLKKKRVTKVLEEVRDDMCSHYCKYPSMYTSDEWEEQYDEICAGCPLDRL